MRADLNSFNVAGKLGQLVARHGPVSAPWIKCWQFRAAAFQIFHTPRLTIKFQQENKLVRLVGFAFNPMLFQEQ